MHRSRWVAESGRGGAHIMSLTDVVAKVPEPPPERLFNAEKLRERTGRAPSPWWWSQPRSPTTGGSRPPSAAHSEFAAMSMGHDLHHDAYVHWLYAQSLGYQGFSANLGEPCGKLVLTAPMPTNDLHADQIAVCGLTPDDQKREFSEFLSALLSFEPKQTVDPRAADAERQRQAEVAAEAERARQARKSKRRGGWQPMRRSKDETSFAPDEQLPVGRLRPSIKRAQRAAAAGRGTRALAMLQEMYADDLLCTYEYREATASITELLAAAKAAGLLDPDLEPEPEPEPEAAPVADTDETDGRDDEPSGPGDNTDKHDEADQAGTDGDGAASVGTAIDTAIDTAEEHAAVPQVTALPLPPLVDRVHIGAVVDCTPHDCSFNEATELSIDISQLFGKYEGEALVVALRKTPVSQSSAGAASTWAPLERTESVSVSELGIATIRVRSFCQIMLVWLQGLEHTQTVAQVLKEGLKASLLMRDQCADAAFRASFRLCCVAALRISGSANGAARFTHKPDVDNAIEASVSAEIFADAERQEAAAAAVAEALRLEEEAAAAAEERIASLPLLLHEACKKGEEAWLADAEANPEKMSIESILEEGRSAGGQLHLWQDKNGYTALYCATMYEQEGAVKLLLSVGSQVDKANNNGVTPLMAAARDGYTPIVKLLLAAGADYKQVDEFGRTADSVADEKGFPETRDAVKAFAEAAAAAATAEE